MAGETWAIGNDGKVTFEGTDFCVTGWTLNEGGDDADTTNTCGGGVKTSLIINTEYTGTFDAQWNVNQSPAGTPNVERGSTGTGRFYVDATSYWEFPIEIKTFDVVSAVGDTIRFTCGWQATGAPTTKP